MTTTSGTPATTHGRPGRLGDPTLELRTDPRSDPRMIAALAPFELDRATPPPPVDRTSPWEAQLSYVAALEAGFESVFAALVADLPPVDGVNHSTETIAGVDGNDIALYISRPRDADGSLPGVLHIHGGGMVVLSATSPSIARFRDVLAQRGVVVIGVEFRNAGGVLGAYPFPAGLNDCTRALEWVNSQRRELGISSVAVVGESGGGNLSAATALKAKKDGRLEMIDGVYPVVPYISGVWGRGESERASELPSLIENDGYLLSCALMDVMAHVYDPGGAHATDPLCWPYHASVDELRGMPPHFISINELDPLRDEGLAYYRKLQQAGVSVEIRTVPAACHAADMILPAQMPDAYNATINSIYDFVKSL